MYNILNILKIWVGPFNFCVFCNSFTDHFINLSEIWNLSELELRHANKALTKIAMIWIKAQLCSEKKKCNISLIMDVSCLAKIM